MSGVSVMRELSAVIDARSGNPVNGGRKWIWRRVELVQHCEEPFGAFNNK